MEKGEAGNRRSRRRMNVRSGGAPAPGASRPPLPAGERIEVRVTPRSFGETMRADIRWVQPLLVFLGLTTFIGYSTCAAFQGKNYYVGNYLSPSCSPEVRGNSPHRCVGRTPRGWP